MRWSVILRYQNAQIPNNINDHPEYIDAERNPVTMACLPTEGDFVIRDSENPEREVTDIARFKEIRTRYEHSPVHRPGRGGTPSRNGHWVSKSSASRVPNSRHSRLTQSPSAACAFSTPGRAHPWALELNHDARCQPGINSTRERNNGKTGGLF